MASRSVSVLALSAATLAFEVLLVRLFSIEQFHHFATMAVGVAMLGVGTAGTAFVLGPAAAGGERADRWFAAAAQLTALTLLLTPLLAEFLTIDPVTLVWDPGQWGRIVLLYLLLAAPFGLGALAQLAAIAASADRPGAVYGAALLGAGLGTALAVGSLWLLNPERSLALPILLASLGAITAAKQADRPATARALALALAGTALLCIARPPWRLRLLPYKAQTQLLALPEARVVAEHNSPVGWVRAVDAPTFRYAPGLSLAYRGKFPRQTALLVDGELAGALSSWDANEARLLEWQPSALPYVAGRRDNVLVIGGGTHEIASAIRHGASSVIAIEWQPALARLGGVSHLPRSSSGADVAWVVGGARAYAGRTAQRFHLITIGPMAGGAPGTDPRPLAEDYDHTVEAYQRYLGLLHQDGVLALTTWTTDPPRGALRALLTTTEALRRVSQTALEQGLVVIRSWATVTILAKPAGFTRREVAALSRWAASRWFDVDWRPGMTAANTRFNFVDRPVLFEAAAAAMSSRSAARQLAEEYPFEVQPATDARPFPHHFVGPRALRRFLQKPQGTWLPFAEWGYVALVATLLQSAGLAVVLLVTPLLIRRLRPGYTSRNEAGPIGRLLGYFGAIGVGFLAAEIAAMQQLTLVLGHPVYAVAGVLAVVLAGSGVGALISDRLRPSPGPVVMLALVLTACAILLLPALHQLEPAPLPVRAGLALLLLSPVAVVMGMPFPQGLRRLAGSSPVRVAWAWSANGFTSVVTAPLAALVALEAGTRSVFLMAAVAYAVAAVCLTKDRGLRTEK